MARQQERAKRTRAAIIGSAAVELSRSGYAAASLNRILEGSGATKGALYFHFDSKEDLAKAVLDAALEQQTGIIEPLFGSPETSPLNALSHYCDEMAVLLEEDMVAQAGIRLAQDPEFYPDVVSAAGGWAQEFVKIAERAVAAGELRPDVDPVRFLWLLLATMSGQFFVNGLGSTPGLKIRFREAFEVMTAAMAAEGWKPDV